MSIFSFLQQIFNKALRAFKSLIEAALPVARQILMGKLSDFTRQTVQELNNTDFNNDQRRKEAFRRIKEYAMTNGIQAKDSMIAALIELAVLSFKKEF